MGGTPARNRFAVLNTVFLQEDGLSADAEVPILCSSQDP